MAIFLNIKSPCMEEWGSMQGDNRVRFCGRCKLNVYNFSDMSELEVRTMLSERTDARLCARIVKRWDGTIVTDNCPYKLRRVRNLIRGFAGAAAITLICLLHSESVSAQNISTLANSSDAGSVMQLADCGYDTARDISRSLTAATFLFSAILGLVRVVDGKKIAHWMNKNGICRQLSNKLAQQRIREALITCVLGPLVVHLVGTFIINNTGALGGAP